MKIECTTPMDHIAAEINAQVERANTVIIRRLQRAGEEAVNVARGQGKTGKDWTDRTGNLRSSVGYVVVCDGEIVFSGGFEGQGDKGVSKGHNYALEIAKRIAKNQYALIVVAGMHYASYVADRGFDVLDSAEMISQKVLNQLSK